VHQVAHGLHFSLSQTETPEQIRKVDDRLFISLQEDRDSRFRTICSRRSYRENAQSIASPARCKRPLAFKAAWIHWILQKAIEPGSPRDDPGHCFCSRVGRKSVRTRPLGLRTAAEATYSGKETQRNWLVRCPMESSRSSLPRHSADSPAKEDTAAWPLHFFPRICSCSGRRCPACPRAENEPAGQNEPDGLLS